MIEHGLAGDVARPRATDLLITLTLPSTFGTIGTSQTFWLRAAFDIAAFVFLRGRMPGLTGRSLEQIEGRLSEGRFRPADLAGPR